MRKTVALLAALIVTGCGIDGPPSKPAPSEGSQITVSGEARIGVVGGF